MKNNNSTRVGSDRKGKKYRRTFRYLYLRLIRLRGHPHELALGMALGVFSGALPILPFHTVLAVFLALLFKASKITAALGTWISNPLNWYFFYYYAYKIGAWMLGIPGAGKSFGSVMSSIRQEEGGWVIFNKMVAAGGDFMGALLLGGLVLAVVFSIPTYFLFLRIFQYVRAYRERHRGEKF